MLSIRDVAEGAVALTGDPAQSPLAIVDLDAPASAADAARAITELSGRTVVTVGYAERPVSTAAAPVMEALTCTVAPAGPGRAWAAVDDGLQRLTRAIMAAPQAALSLANLLPATARADVFDGLQGESLAYSTLLAGPEFAAWRAATPRREPGAATEPVTVDRDGSRLEVTLNRPERHNAFGHAVRDGLIEALTMAVLDDSIEHVRLRGAGKSFCSGGDLDEFGTAADPVAAHVTRLGRSAGWMVHRLRERIVAELHGACIGAGIEVPAFAARIEARDNTFFQLPELSMGLIPGAGGTVSLTHRIGRHRTAYLALSGDRIDVATALAWGLVDGRV
ncbi:enoyl-CoA hydratase/isomerase family protein [Streptomyces sp. NPDC021080]|uniref:enoyl-CoA hydratase/isomerase family protein n=1 Tax=Streptomyces sp. NPDC021080 TaxID=3365110 RepID=UPI0037A546B1